MKKRLPGKVIMERKAMFVSKISNKNSKVILKVHFGNDSFKKEMLSRENVALEVLKGLAVPKRVILPHDKVKKFLKEKQFCHIAMEWIPWRGCFGRRFSAAESAALWAFTIEQLCAFRRRDVLYTDLKHNHLRVADDLSAARIIDFDACIMVDPKDLYPTYGLSNTGELSPPEFYFSDVQTEKYVVYQVGMLLGSFLLQYFHNNHITPVNLEKMKKSLKKNKMREVFNIFQNCISKKQSHRPKNLEVLFDLLQKVELSPTSYKIWKSLRAPFREELQKLGFQDPGTTHHTSLKAA